MAMSGEASDAVTRTDLRYRDGLDARVYTPTTGGSFPAVVAVHGGAWVGGNRFTHEPSVEHLAANGIAMMAIEFAMAPAARYPEPIADIAAALGWLRDNAERFDIDAGRIGGFGLSSGAHQLLLAALRPSDPRWSATPACPCAFVLIAFGVTDPLARYQMALKRPREDLVSAHNAYWPDVDAMTEGNPQLILERGEAECLPPLLCLQGTDDENLTEDMAERFVTAYRKAGGDAVLEVFPGEPHAFLDRAPDSAASQSALASAVAFVHAH
ncbi:MAG TPA: alpha/beta hydrolase [Solirubrobacteraceae bacterium]|jgi:acetyl esterase/lipase